MLAQLGSADMRIPIAYALAWPDRMETPAARLDLLEVARLDFEAPDLDRFPALRLAREALEAGGAAPVVLNAANEIAVELFLDRRIGFAEIPAIVEAALCDATQALRAAVDRGRRRARCRDPEQRPRASGRSCTLMPADTPLWLILLAFVLAIGPLVFIHELGHFLVGADARGRRRDLFDRLRPRDRRLDG